MTSSSTASTRTQQPRPLTPSLVTHTLWRTASRQSPTCSRAVGCPGLEQVVLEPRESGPIESAPVWAPRITPRHRHHSQSTSAHRSIQPQTPT
ncbi:hypothetical protein CNYM01_01622 [Colletotrichum nymphaeae SA-01]|uniref:Uncharacterized protein n=1 Tax=Colletotrichum nymphaeae SA-01 TaxID=1460502 RepID=A0A135UIV2_9PEZI|nr:hypothetical protein CNYM01_01622 [Colletotrichum nymphaeae SA-01]